MCKRQEELEKEIDHLENTIAGMQSRLEEKKKLLDKEREYIDAIILGNFNLGELRTEFELTDKQAEKIYDMITDQYVRIWFNKGKMEIVKKR